ncbi:importin subunit beta-2 [[Candida] anglica]
MWTPDPQALDQLQHILRGTLSTSAADRKAANDALDSAKLQPEIENYLLIILVGDDSSKQIRSDTRASAGLILKNMVVRAASGISGSARMADRSYLLDNILHGLVSPDTMVRNITGTVITALFSIYGLDRWPICLPSLVQLAQQAGNGGDVAASEGAMGALSKICEDSGSSLDREVNGTRPLDELIPQLLSLTDSTSAKIRALAVHCLNQFTPYLSQSFLVHLDSFLQRLFALATDTSSEVRKNVCVGFSAVLHARADKLHPHLDGVINYCLHSMQDTDEEVAVEACEFLLALASTSTQELDRSVFSPKLSQILPVLLEKMVYSQEEIFLMQLADDKDSADVADKDEDIRPQNIKAKHHKVGKTKDESDGNESDSEGESDDDDDSDDEDDFSEWSLRKCSASTLDILSVSLPGEVLEVILPILQERIVSPDWPVREASILAFGAVSRSCIELASDKLPTLVPFLVDRLSDDQPRVRQITCWTLSRFAEWVCSEAHEGGQYASFFQPTFQTIVERALDPKKVVQEAACSALSSFIEDSDSSLISFYIAPLLEHFGRCFRSYQRKNMIILYDCVQTFVEKMGYELLAPHVDQLLPSLLEKWQVLSDDDPDLWPLLECMASVAATLQDIFAPYAMPVYERAINILSSSIQLDQQCHTDPSIEPPEKDFMVTSLDLIDGLIQGLGTHSLELVQAAPTPLMDLLLLTLEDHTDDVRQSAYALLGDLAIHTLPLLEPYLHALFIGIGHEIDNRSYNSFAVYNNAIWALGELSMRVDGSALQPFLPNLLNLLVRVLRSTDSQQTVLENVAICIGRMGLNGCAETIAPRLHEFVGEWCAQMLYLIDNEEKETAYEGMLNIINANPDQGFGGLANQQGRKNLSVFITCIGNYPNAPEPLKMKFAQLLQSYRQMVGEAVWNQIVSQVDAETRQALGL